MNASQEQHSQSRTSAVFLVILAILAFNAACAFRSMGWLVIAFAFTLTELTLLPSPRIAFWTGLGIGLGLYAPNLTFFWTIFHGAAIALWTVLAVWIGLFLLAGQVARRRLSPLVFALVIPFLWTGFEYFRSELYYLRFSWFTLGWIFPAGLQLTDGIVGVYGLGFVIIAIIGVLSLLSLRKRFLVTCILAALLGFAPRLLSPRQTSAGKGQTIHVAGAQMEFPTENQVLYALKKLRVQSAETELFVLSEYTFQEPIPKRIRDWCGASQKYLIVGGIEPAGSNYYNTAFVVGPGGDVVFKQAKSVPIQFFKDGLPAPSQKVWNSPWGKIGICVCYDLSYRCVVDELIRQGAKALIVPTMDVEDWGLKQHLLHSQIGPMRATEYHVPIFRVCSSGISQCVDAKGFVQASAPFPGDGALIKGELRMSTSGRLPLDRFLGPMAVVVTVLVGVFLAIPRSKCKRPSSMRFTEN